MWENDRSTHQLICLAWVDTKPHGEFDSLVKLCKSDFFKFRDPLNEVLFSTGLHLHVSRSILLTFLLHLAFSEVQADLLQPAGCLILPLNPIPLPINRQLAIGNYSTVRPICRAVPSIVRIADSKLVVFRSC